MFLCSPEDDKDMQIGLHGDTDGHTESDATSDPDSSGKCVLNGCMTFHALA